MHFGLAGFAATALALAPYTSLGATGVNEPNSLANQTQSAVPAAKRDGVAHGQPRLSSEEFKVWMTGTFDSPFGLTILSPAGGKYDYDGGTLTVTRINGATMEGIWHQNSAGKCPDGGYWGHYRFIFTRTGFTGTFGHCEGPLIASGWKGTRRM
jgi:hypothetical protein